MKLKSSIISLITAFCFAVSSFTMNVSAISADVATGEKPFNPIFIVILVVAVIAVVLALVPTFRKKK